MKNPILIVPFLISTLNVVVVSGCDTADECDVWDTYCRVLRRSAEGDDGSKGFIAKIANGEKTIRDLVLDLCESEEYEGKFVSDRDSIDIVKDLYDNILAREADSSGLEHWSDALDTGERKYRDICQNFVDSSEYAEKNGSSGVPGGGRSGCGTKDGYHDVPEDEEPVEEPTLCVPWEWSKWSKWTDCSETCDGLKSRERECECPASDVDDCCDEKCSGDDIDIDKCNEKEGDPFILKHYYDEYYLQNGALKVDLATDESKASVFQECGKQIVFSDDWSEDGCDECYCLEEYCCGIEIPDTDFYKDYRDVKIESCNGEKEQEWELKKVKVDDKYYKQLRSKKKKCCVSYFSDEDVVCKDCDKEDYSQLWEEVDI